MQNYRNGIAIIEDIIFGFDDMSLFADNRTQTVGNGYYPFQANRRSDAVFCCLHCILIVKYTTERMVCVPYNL